MDEVAIDSAQTRKLLQKLSYDLLARMKKKGAMEPWTDA